MFDVSSCTAAQRSMPDHMHIQLVHMTVGCTPDLQPYVLPQIAAVLTTVKQTCLHLSSKSLCTTDCLTFLQHVTLGLFAAAADS